MYVCLCLVAVELFVIVYHRVIFIFISYDCYLVTLNPPGSRHCIAVAGVFFPKVLFIIKKAVCLIILIPL